LEFIGGASSPRQADPDMPTSARKRTKAGPKAGFQS